MKPVASFVREIVDESEVALTALVEGYLNLSAYAKRIKPEVQRRARKDVAVGTIVVALCRYEIDARKRAALTPKVRLETISTRTALVEVSFNKTAKTTALLQAVYANEKLQEAEVLTVTSGIRELSLIFPEALKGEVLKVFKRETPTLIVEDLASLTLRFPPKYIHTPNAIFSMLRPLALNRINIVEVVSTYTELTVVVAQRDLQDAFAVLSELPHSGK
jgi:hypothetical protein